MKTSSEIIEENFEGLQDAMGGEKWLSDWYKDLIQHCMIEFAKQYIPPALNEAAKKADWYHNGYDIIIDENSILTAYSLENIK